MKNKSIVLWASVVCFLILTSCKRAPEKSETATSSGNVEVLITENEGAYPQDVDLFGSNSVNGRLQDLLGEEYKEVKANFETETPIVMEDHIYKFTGCKAHDCPSFLTRIYYDADHDNFNVLITRSGKVKIYTEKDQIRVPKVLEVK